jgi:hypothetical protein
MTCERCERISVRYVMRVAVQLDKPVVAWTPIGPGIQACNMPLSSSLTKFCGLGRPHKHGSQVMFSTCAGKVSPSSLLHGSGNTIEDRPGLSIGLPHLSPCVPF